MKNKVLSILGTIAIAALFMVNLTFSSSTLNNDNVTITAKEAKATVHYKNYKNRTFHRGCKSSSAICELTSPDAVY